MNAESYRFNVGRFECIAVYDGAHTYTASQYFANAPADVLVQELSKHGLSPDEIPSPYSGLVINTGAHQVLVDTGAGDSMPGAGKLLHNLQARGIAPEEIDTVILTHGHPDHLGGTTGADGQPVFANARHVLYRDEWDYWTSEASAAHPVNRNFVSFARKNLLPLRGMSDLIDGETEIVPGIRAFPTPGHTPGHMALAIASGSDELLYISDTALHPLHLEHPDWRPIFDLDAEQAGVSQRRLFDRAAAEKALVLAFHFYPFPSLGHVAQDGRGWQWQPIQTGLSLVCAPGSTVSE